MKDSPKWTVKIHLYSFSVIAQLVTLYLFVTKTKRRLAYALSVLIFLERGLVELGLWLYGKRMMEVAAQQEELAKRIIESVSRGEENGFTF